MKHDHVFAVSKVRKEIPNDELLCELSDLFKLFGDSTRIKILFSLFECELCVCAICEILNMEQSAVSHQLKKLKRANLVKCRREGKTMMYSLADEHVRGLISLGFEHLTEERTR